MERVVAVADADPNSPSLAEARERFLQDCIDAPYWNPPYRKPNFSPRPKAAPPPPPPGNLITIDIDQERKAVARLYAAWQKELAARQQAIDDAVASHASPGNNYWLPEARARARWIAAANFVEMLEGSHHADARQPDSGAART